MKKRLVSLLLVFALLMTQVLGLGSMRVKASENNFSVQVIVESNKEIIVNQASNKNNAFEALLDALTKANIPQEKNKFTDTAYGKSLDMINNIKSGIDNLYWMYQINRKNSYVNILTSIDGSELQNGDRLIVYLGGFETPHANKITYSSKVAKTPITISLENYSEFNNPNVKAISNINVKIYRNDESKTIIIPETAITENKINMPQGLEVGTYVLEISDFKEKGAPGVVADTFTFDITEEVSDGNSDNEEKPNNPYDRDNKNIVKDIKSDLNSTSNFVKNNSSGDSWAILSLSKLGLAPDLTYIKESAAEIIKNKGLNDYTNTDIEKLIIVLTSAGYNPYNFMGYNLVAELYNRDIDSFLINDAIYGLIAYNYANIEANYVITKDKLVEFILKNKLSYKENNTDIVGWALSGDKINPDITGLAINALSNYYEKNAVVKDNVDLAVNSLSKLQTESGYLADSYGYFSESIDVVILGLTALGINPEGDKFTKSKGDLVSALLSYKGTDGQFKHSLEGKNDYIASEQTLRALIALDEFKAIGKYNFYGSSIDSSKLPEFKLSEEELLKLGVLPQTGSAMDFTSIIFIGTLSIILGTVLFKRKRA
jgi:LPXTG-motif cell wall-anchored protein